MPPRECRRRSRGEGSSCSCLPPDQNTYSITPVMYLSLLVSTPSPPALTFVKAGFTNTSLRPWIEAFAWTARLVFMLQPVQSPAAHLSCQPAQERHRGPQDQEVRSQCGEHGERAEPAKQAQRRQIGEDRDDQTTGKHHGGENQGRSNKHGCPLHSDRRVLVRPFLLPQPVQEMNGGAEG